MRARTLTLTVAASAATAGLLAVNVIRAPEQVEGEIVPNVPDRTPRELGARAPASRAADEAGDVERELQLVDSRGGITGAGDVEARAAAERRSSPVTAAHTQLQALPVGTRNFLLLRTVRDAGYSCESVNSATAFPDAPLWRVSCSGAHFFEVSVDEIGQLRARALDNWDGVTPPFDAPQRRTLELVEPQRNP